MVKSMMTEHDRSGDAAKLAEEIATAPGVHIEHADNVLVITGAVSGVTLRGQVIVEEAHQRRGVRATGTVETGQQ